MNSDRRIPVVLLLLRLSVFLVMLMWTLDKFVNPDHAAAIFQNFYPSRPEKTLAFSDGMNQDILALGYRP